MSSRNLDGLSAQIGTLSPVRTVGRVTGVNGGVVHVSGLGHIARIGDQIRLDRRDKLPLRGEIVQLSGQEAVILAESSPEGVSLNDRVSLLDCADIAPSDSWIGRVVDPFGLPLDGRPLLRGKQARPLRADPPSAATRRCMGDRMNTGMAALNTLLPIVQGQRVGLFAGSGVGKSNLMGHLARHMQADIVVIAMIGERGRELRSFIEDVLGPEGMARSVIIAATSDQSPLIRRRCAWSAMSVAEHFRDQGKDVLLLMDSLTRFAQAQREIALAIGEPPATKGYPPSVFAKLPRLVERKR